MPIRPRTAPRVAQRPTARHEPTRVAPLRQRPLLFNFDPTLSSVEQGRRKTQWVVLVTLVTVVLVLLVGGAGIYINNIRQPSTPVAVVNGEPIRRDTWQHYQALVIAELQGQAQQLQAGHPVGQWTFFNDHK